METITLNGAEISDTAALHAALAEQLNFPDWYGANLDALHDLLSERRRPLRVVVRNRAALRAHIGAAYYARFLRVLYDSGVYAEARED